MSQNHDFRFQSSTPSTPAAGIATYYVNSSGVLKYVHPNGNVYGTSSVFDTTGVATNLTTGLAVFTNAATGIVYGGTGTQNKATVLGVPDFWLNVVGPNGQLLSVPAYTRSA